MGAVRSTGANRKRTYRVRKRLMVWLISCRKWKGRNGCFDRAVSHLRWVLASAAFACSSFTGSVHAGKQGCMCTRVYVCLHTNTPYSMNETVTDVGTYSNTYTPPAVSASTMAAPCVLCPQARGGKQSQHQP